MRVQHSAIEIVIAIILIISFPGIGKDNATAGQSVIPATSGIEVDRQPVDLQPGVAAYQSSTNPFEIPISKDPYLDKQWALFQMNATSAWQVTKGDPKIVVAVLDTGIDAGHEDLGGKVIAEVNFTDSPTTSDINGHGTEVAGIICASSDNGKGISGLAPECKLMNVKVADDQGRCEETAVAKGVIWAVDRGASVINISLEFKHGSDELEQAIDYAWNQGVIVIAAAGNDGSDLPVYPAGYDNCISVAATRQDGTLAPFSNFGEWVDVAAPGFNILTTTCGNSYNYQGGTSFAAAYVSGLAALLLSVATNSNGNDKLNEEVRTAIEFGSRGTVQAIGKIRIDAIGSFIRMGIVTGNQN